MRTVSFSGYCPARGKITLVTPRIAHPFIIDKIHCRFPLGCLDLMKLRFYVSYDADAPSTVPPNGYSMLKDYGQVDYIIGDGDEKDMVHSLEVPESGAYLKVYAVNDDYFQHLVDVQITIEPTPRKEP